MNPFTNLSTFASATSPNVITLSSKSITTSSCAPCWISLCWFSLCWFSELKLIVTSGSSLSYVSLSKSARSMDWDLSGVLFLGLWTALSGVLFLGLWTALAGVLVLELWDDDAEILAIELWGDDAGVLVIELWGDDTGVELWGDDVSELSFSEVDAGMFALDDGFVRVNDFVKVEKDFSPVILVGSDGEITEVDDDPVISGASEVIDLDLLLVIIFLCLDP